MTNEEFIEKLAKPMYIWRMAFGLRDGDSRMAKSARTRSSNAEAEINELVKERARSLGMRDDFGTT